jgi:hypothetical protein
MLLRTTNRVLTQNHNTRGCGSLAQTPFGERHIDQRSWAQESNALITPSNAYNWLRSTTKASMTSMASWRRSDGTRVVVSQMPHVAQNMHR